MSDYDKPKRKINGKRNLKYDKWWRKYTIKGWMSMRNNNFIYKGLKNEDGTQFTIEDKYKMLKNQNWTCPISGNDLELNEHSHHNKITGIVKCIVSERVNLAFGGFNEDKEELLRAVIYL